MNTSQKLLVIIGIALFLLIGIAMLLFLFTGFAFEVSSGDRIAVIDMYGEISGSEPMLDSSISAPEMRRRFEEAEDDPSVVGVVLRINSGGGEVIESKEIARIVEEFPEDRPVVAYLQDVAASGAYYVASAADYIIADEDSLVGSIGVISTYLVYEELLEDKLGINVTVLKSGKFKDIGSPYRQITGEEKERLQEIIDQIHERFLDIIAARRGLSQSDIERIETGGIFLGSEAVGIGLVDSLGGFNDAIGVVKTLTKCDPDAELCYLDEEEDPNTERFYSLGRGLGDSLASRLELSRFSLEY